MRGVCLGAGIWGSRDSLQPCRYCPFYAAGCRPERTVFGVRSFCRGAGEWIFCRFLFCLFFFLLFLFLLLVATIFIIECFYFFGQFLDSGLFRSEFGCGLTAGARHPAGVARKNIAGIKKGFCVFFFESCVHLPTQLFPFGGSHCFSAFFFCFCRFFSCFGIAVLSSFADINKSAYAERRICSRYITRIESPVANKGAGVAQAPCSEPLKESPLGFPITQSFTARHGVSGRPGGIAAEPRPRSGSSTDRKASSKFGPRGDGAGNPARSFAGHPAPLFDHPVGGFERHVHHGDNEPHLYCDGPHRVEQAGSRPLAAGAVEVVEDAVDEPARLRVAELVHKADQYVVHKEEHRRIEGKFDEILLPLFVKFLCIGERPGDKRQRCRDNDKPQPHHPHHKLDPGHQEDAE